MTKLKGRIGEKRKKRKRGERDEERKRKRGVTVSALCLSTYVRTYVPCIYWRVWGTSVAPHKTEHGTSAL